jgi:hypothetical protein
MQQLGAVQRLAVVIDGKLVFRAFVDILKNAFRQPPLRGSAQIGNVVATV